MATAKNVKPTTKNSPPVPLGHAKNNKPATTYAANGTSVADEKRAVSGMRDPNTLSADEQGPGTAAMRVSIGNKTRDAKTSGVQMRGTGAATKGKMSRGPMA